MRISLELKVSIANPQLSFTMKAMRNFSARETEWLQELDGIELAGFRRRAFAFLIDGALLVFIVALVAGLGAGAYLAVLTLIGRALPEHLNIMVGDEKHHVHLLQEIIAPILYWGLLTWQGKGCSPGKRLMKIRVVSLVHRHLSLWHSVERALGYGAAALEGGFGFFQYFIHPYRRCVQDRIAETIVVTERSYVALQSRLEHPLLPDDG